MRSRGESNPHLKIDNLVCTNQYTTRAWSRDFYNLFDITERSVLLRFSTNRGPSNRIRTCMHPLTFQLVRSQRVYARMLACKRDRVTPATICRNRVLSAPRTSQVCHFLLHYLAYIHYFTRCCVLCQVPMRGET